MVYPDLEVLRLALGKAQDNKASAVTTPLKKTKRLFNMCYFDHAKPIKWYTATVG